MAIFVSFVLGTNSLLRIADCMVVRRVSDLAGKYHFESFLRHESTRFLRNSGRKHPFLLAAFSLEPHDPFSLAERFAEMLWVPDMKLLERQDKVDLTMLRRVIRQHIEYNWATPALWDLEQEKRRMPGTTT